MQSTLSLILTVSIMLVAITQPGLARYIPKNEGGYYGEDPHNKPQGTQIMQGGYYAQDMGHYNQEYAKIGQGIYIILRICIIL